MKLEYLFWRLQWLCHSIYCTFSQRKPIQLKMFSNKYKIQRMYMRKTSILLIPPREIISDSDNIDRTTSEHDPYLRILALSYQWGPEESTLIIHYFSNKLSLVHDNWYDTLAVLVSKQQVAILSPWSCIDYRSTTVLFFSCL